MPLEFSANLGFLWNTLPLIKAMGLAKSAGFAAVELHWPYATPAGDVWAASQAMALPILSLNTDRGAAGEFGLCALPHRNNQARASIDQALTYGAAIGAASVHVMAGNATGPAAHNCFLENLRYASGQAAPLGIQILIEPLNAHDAPHYFLRTTDQAIAIIETLNLGNLKLMFDCYHVARTEGDVLRRLHDLWPMIGHIQCAGVPDRGPLHISTLDYRQVFQTIENLGPTMPIGAEYICPATAVADSLEWMPNHPTDTYIDLP
ncbi:MAG: TIM barrel protein [Pseudomonadota bacterium]